MSLKPYKKMKMKAVAAVELPFSLIESEILPRVAAKSDIGRCRCVCKQWKSSLSTPSFARMHLHNHGTINDYKLLLFDGFTFRTLDRSSTTIPSFNPNPNPNSVFILATLDGLVCLGSKELSTRQLVFWNPLTGSYKKLSSGPRFSFSNKVATDAIGFYMDSSYDYKLVCVIGGGLLNGGAFIYSNRLDSWRGIEFPFPSFEMCVWSPATLCGQRLYFIVRAYTLSIEGDWWIICFDVNTETFRKIIFPTVPYGAMERCGSLVLLNGCVHLCVSYNITPYMKKGDLWRLNADYGWEKVAAFSDPWDADVRVTRQHICTTSTGNWLVVLDEEKTCFQKVNMEDFTTHYQYFCYPSWEYRSSRMIYRETLVSPNP